MSATVNAPALCFEPYVRSDVFGSKFVTQYCQHPRRHLGTHSWFELREADLAILRTAERAALAQPAVPCEDEEDVDLAAAHAIKVCNNILLGAYDPYLEMLLAAGHDRKRALRGTFGFGATEGGSRPPRGPRR